jgi:hypothetical protein
MRVMSDVTNPLAREHTMTKVQGKGEVIDIKALLAGDAEFLRAAAKAAIEAALEAAPALRSSPPGVCTRSVGG